MRLTLKHAFLWERIIVPILRHIGKLNVTYYGNLWRRSRRGLSSSLIGRTIDKSIPLRVVYPRLLGLIYFDGCRIKKWKAGKKVRLCPPHLYSSFTRCATDVAGPKMFIKRSSPVSYLLKFFHSNFFWIKKCWLLNIFNSKSHKFCS